LHHFIASGAQLSVGGWSQSTINKNEASCLIAE
jgi:hypothetical protein